MAEHQPPQLFLIDGYALIYRAFFALISRPLRTARGENTSAVWGVTNFLLRLRDKYRPDYVVWINDAGDSFRTAEYAEYKSTREKLDDELQADFDRAVERVRTLLEGFRIPLVEVAGYEADDVIGTLALRAAALGLEAVIVSGDKDFYQLIRPGVVLLNPGRGGPAGVEELWVTEANASERLGVAAVARSPTGSPSSGTHRTTFQASRVSVKRERSSSSRNSAISRRCSPELATSSRSAPAKRCSSRRMRRGCPAGW